MPSSRPREIDIAPWLAGVQWRLPKSTLALLDAELVEFNRWITPTKSEVSARKCVVEFFQRIVQTLWWDAEVMECGSITTGLFSTDDAIELTIISPSFNVRESNPVELITALFRTIVASPAEFVERSHLVESAIVPLLHIVTTQAFGDFSLSVAIGTTILARETEEIERLFQELGERRKGRARKLARVVTELLRARGLLESENGGLNYLGVLMLVISFVQREDLISSSGKPLPATDLIAFLSCYAKFDFRTNAVSTHTRTGLIKRSVKGWTSNLDFLSIQHPVDRARDLASTVYQSRCIIDLFQQTADYLVRFSTSSAGDLFRFAIEKKSILAVIGIQIPPKTIRRRKLRLAMWERGDFGRMESISLFADEEEDEDDVCLAVLLAKRLRMEEQDDPFRELARRQSMRYELY